MDRKPGKGTNVRNVSKEIYLIKFFIKKSPRDNRYSWEDSQLKGPVIIFNKIIEENFLNLKKEMPKNIQEAYRTQSILNQKRNSSCHIIVKTSNAQNKVLKAVREKGQVTYKGRPIRIRPET